MPTGIWSTETAIKHEYNVSFVFESRQFYQSTIAIRSTKIWSYDAHAFTYHRHSLLVVAIFLKIINIGYFIYLIRDYRMIYQVNNPLFLLTHYDKSVTNNTINPLIVIHQFIYGL
jgi:hypothetical protein